MKGMASLPPSRVGVIGASYGGLCAALALRCVGCDVRVFERSPDFDRIGGGIVVQPEFAEYLEAFGYARPEQVAVPTVKRRFLERSGAVAHSTGDNTFYTAWDTLLRSLRDAFDANKISNGMTLVDIAQDDDSVSCRFHDGSEHVFDLLVAADGIGSTVRRRFMPEVSPRYAGYVGFRGLVPEDRLTAAQAELIRNSFVLFAYPHSHILNYLIPGEDGSTQPNRLRWNWVWYVTRSEEELDGLLRDHNGERHRVSLGPGEMRGESAEWLRSRAQADLPPLLREIVDQTVDPFVQAIFDLQTPRMVFDRVVLLGDAACVVRPHTASGTSKAAADATTLAHALRDAGGQGLTAALAGWEADRLAYAQRLTEYGQMTAERGGLGG